MSCKLREFIRSVRAAQTAADERAVVAKECAEIRAAFKDGDSRTRPRNVAKALFMSLLGYSTEFAQLECVKLVASSRFGEKRVGYLGLTCLLDEQSEVLLLATNTIKNDLQHPNQYVNGLALTALGNIGTPDMCVAALDSLNRGNPYIFKKALLCTARLVRQGEDVEEKALAALALAFRETDHGVQLAACALCLALLDRQPEALAAKKLAPLLPDISKALLSCRLWKAEYRSNEYDIGGVSDPFLHCALMRVASTILQHMSPEDGRPYLSVDLLFIAVNTSSTKNTGNCVLYECAKAVLRSKKERAQAWYISAGMNTGVYSAVFKNLGKMLTAGDPNAKYVALELLQQGVHVDLEAVMERREVIVECLKDPDPSLRRRAVDVIFSLMVRNKHVTSLVKELLNVLLLLGHADKEFKDLLINKIVAATLSYGTSMQWQLDTLFKIMSVAGQAVDDLVTYSFIEVALGAPQLQSYVVHKIFFALQDPFSNNAALWQAGLYCIGEFGEYLVQPLKKKKKIAGQMVGTAASKAFQISPKQVASLLASYADQLSTLPREQRIVLTQTLVTAAAKLAAKLPSQRENLIVLLQRFVNDGDVEVQQRAVESVGVLVAEEWSDSSIFDRMPFDVGINKKEDTAKPPRWYRKFRAIGLGCFDPTDVPLVLNDEATGAEEQPQEENEGEDDGDEEEDEQKDEEDEQKDKQAKIRQQNNAFLLDEDLFIEKRPALDEANGAPGSAVFALPNSNSNNSTAGVGTEGAAAQRVDMWSVLDFDTGGNTEKANKIHTPPLNGSGTQAPPDQQNHTAATIAGSGKQGGAVGGSSDLDALSLVFDVPSNSVNRTTAANPAATDPFFDTAATPLSNVSPAPGAFMPTTAPAFRGGNFDVSATAAAPPVNAAVPAVPPSNAAIDNSPFSLDLGLATNNSVAAEGFRADALTRSGLQPPSATAGEFSLNKPNAALTVAFPAAGGTPGTAIDNFDPFTTTLKQQEQLKQQDVHTVNVLNDEAGLSLSLVCMRKGQGEGASIRAEFRNTSTSPLTNLLFEVAVPKYLKLALQPATATTVPPMSTGVVQQQMYVTPATGGSGGSVEKRDKPLALKCRISFTKGGETLQKCVNVHDLPPLLS